MEKLSVVTLRARLRDLEQARSELPPHSAQGMHEELDDRIRTVRRQLVKATTAGDSPS